MFGKHDELGMAGFEDIVGGSYLLNGVDLVGQDGMGVGETKRLVSSAPSKWRRTVCPVPPSSALATNGTAELQTQPQYPFRIARLSVPSDIAFYFSLTDLKVGQQTQFVASGAIPMAIFTEVAVHAFLHTDTASVGNTITLSVRNDDASSRTWKGSLLGIMAK